MADSGSACPHRQFMDEPGIQWREGKPDFSKVNKAYLEGRTRTHKEGSLEKIVEDLVKTWEMEASHKTRIEVKRNLLCPCTSFHKLTLQYFFWSIENCPFSVEHICILSAWKIYMSFHTRKDSVTVNTCNKLIHQKCLPPLWEQDWQSVDREAFTIRANNQRSFCLKEAIEEGNYNVLMQNQPLYNSEAHTFESSHHLFRSAFDQGFPWELIEVFSGK